MSMPERKTGPARTIVHNEVVVTNRDSSGRRSGIYGVTSVNVERHEQVLYQSVISRNFSSVQRLTGINIPKPLYEQRVRRAVKKAHKITEKYNIGKLPRERKLRE